MYQRLKHRGYSTDVLNHAYVKAKSTDRRSLFQKSTRQAPQRKLFHHSVQHHECCHTMTTLIRSRASSKEIGLYSDSALKTVFPNFPAFALRRAPTHQDNLVRSYLPPTRGQSSWLQCPVSNFSCGRHTHCMNITKTDRFKDVFSENIYHI